LQRFVTRDAGSGMSAQALAPRHAADIIRIGAGLANALAAQACQRARILLRPVLASAAARLQGDVVLIEAAVVDEPVQLLVAEIRRTSAAQIILLSPALSVDQRILAFTHGADHVLDATIDERELAAILRNAVRLQAPASSRPRAGEEHQHWMLEPDRWMLIAPSGREIRLTHSEYAVLELLIGQAGVVQPRATLRAVVDGDASRKRVLDVLISRLRRKVWDVAGIELPLRSARSAGYVFAGGVARAAVPAPALISRTKAATPG
jgi:two-component system, OmpR family, response regulator